MPKPDSGRERYWRGVIADCEASGLSRMAYCKQHGISYTQLQNWRRRLPARDAQAIARQRRERRRAAQRKQESVEFLPVRIVEKPKEEVALGPARVELVFKSGTIMRLDAECPLAFLSSVISLLEDR
jgi:transposase-like protein